MIRLGTSGFSYDDWVGAFYPPGLPKREWLAYYAREFDTVELNVTYYRIPDRRTVVGWTERTPPGFLFAVKAFGGSDARTSGTGFRRLRRGDRAAAPGGETRLHPGAVPLRLHPDSGELGLSRAAAGGPGRSRRRGRVPSERMGPAGNVRAHESARPGILLRRRTSPGGLDAAAGAGHRPRRLRPVPRTERASSGGSMIRRGSDTTTPIRRASSRNGSPG